MSVRGFCSRPARVGKQPKPLASVASNKMATTVSGSRTGRTPTPTKRPSTSSGLSTSRSESVSSYTTSRISSFSRKSSFSTAKSPKRRNNSAVVYLSPERRLNSLSTKYDNYPLPAFHSTSQEESAPRSADSYVQVVDRVEAAQTPPSPTESFTSTTPYVNMLVRPGTGYQSTAPNGPPAFASMQPPSPTLETITYQHIQETSSKRISTLDYLRKA